MGWFVAQQAVNAAIVCSFYALFAVAFVLVLGVADRVNLAFGAVATWAGYTAVGVADGLLTVTFWAPAVIVICAGVMALANGAGFGAVFGRSMMARLVGAPPLAAFVATLGLAIALEEGVRLLTASREQWLEPILIDPLWTLRFADQTVYITVMQAVVVAMAAASCGVVVIVMRASRFGRAWRAVAQDAGMARLVGVDVAGVVTTACAVSGLLVSQAGAGFALYYGNIAPYSGFTMGLKALFIAIVGGGRSVTGALAGAVAIGVFETGWSAVLPIALRDAASFAVLIAALIVWAPGRANIYARG